MLSTVIVLLLMAGSAVVGALLAGWRPAAALPAVTTPEHAVAALPNGPMSAGAGALALLDADHLASFNRASGFDYGDRLLDQIQQVLTRALPDGAQLDRTDGGRFAVWLPDADLTQAMDKVEVLRVAGSSAFVQLPDQSIGSRTLSAGLVVVGAAHDRGRALLHADCALSNAKLLGGNRLEVQKADAPLPNGPSRAEIEEAIATGALRYHVQPIVDVTEDSVAGFEALLRWARTDGSVVGPADFLEELNRVPDYAADLLPDLAEQVAQPFVHGDPPMFLTLNITAAVLDSKDGPGCRWLQEVLRRLPADHLVVEIVETAVIAQPDRAHDLVARLRDRGVRVALDDFGTGLSNLDRLRRMPVDFLKIDRTFIADLGGDGRAETILRNLVRMAGELGMDLIAEGIETVAQADAIKDLGIRYAQGYHLGRPGPADQWAADLARETSANG